MTDFTARMSLSQISSPSDSWNQSGDETIKKQRPRSSITKNPSLIASKTLSPWWGGPGPKRPRAWRLLIYPPQLSEASWWWEGAGWGRCCSMCSAEWSLSCQGSKTVHNPCPCKAGERRREAPSAGRSSQCGSSRRHCSTRGWGLTINVKLIQEFLGNALFLLENLSQCPLKVEQHIIKMFHVRKHFIII